MDIVFIAAGLGIFVVFGLYATFAAARLTMIVSVLYVLGAVGITVYMLVALLRPDKF